MFIQCVTAVQIRPTPPLTMTYPVGLSDVEVKDVVIRRSSLVGTFDVVF